MPTLEELISRISQLESVSSAMNEFHTQVDDLSRQVQRLQGGSGLLEPISPISGYNETNPQTTPASGTFVGQAQMLLAGSGLAFQRAANSPFLRLKIAGAMMNADYVVASDGSGTHLTLFGASGALAAAIASQVSKSIWVCTTHVETVTTARFIFGALAAGQRITIASLGEAAATINVGDLGGQGLIMFNVTSPDTAWLQFENINFKKVSSNDSPMMEGNTSVGLPNLRFTGVGWIASTSNWSYLFDASTTPPGNTSSPRALTLEACWGAITHLVKTTFSTPAIPYPFIMRGNDMTLTHISERPTEAAVEWGGSNPVDPGVQIIGNRFVIAGYAWKKSYDMPFEFAGNLIYHTGAVPLLNIGSPSASNTITNADINGNMYVASTGGGGSFAVVANSLGPCRNISIVGNALYGPGNGTAITTVASTDCVFEPNSYYNWTTNISGAGVTKFSGNVTIGGTFSATIAHSSLTNLVAPADDHTQYAILAGRGTPVGNIFIGYASWGTSAAGYSSTVLSFTPGAYWRMGEAAGNLTDSSGNANTATQVGAGQTYSQTGAITGDANTAIKFPGVATSYYTVANSASVNTGDTFTAMAWIKLTAGGTNQVIMDTHSGVGTGFIFRVGTGNLLELVFSDVSLIVSSTVAVPTTGYHHVVVAKNAGVSTKLYLDNVDVTGAVTNQTIVASGAGLVLGRYNNGASQPFNGTMDEVALFGTFLSAANVSTIYNAGLGAPSPVNTTNGDVTCLRLNVGNAAFPTGAEAYIGGDTVVTGWTRIGSATVPANTTAGDLTIGRLNIAGNSAFTNANQIVNAIVPSFTPTASYNTMDYSITLTPNGGNFNVNLMAFTIADNPTLADSGSMDGIVMAMSHGGSGVATSGFPICFDAQHTLNRTGGSLGQAFNFRSLWTFSNGNVTTQAVGYTSRLLTFSAGTVTSFIHYLVQQTATISGTLTTSTGLQIPNLGAANVTNALGIDIAAQSGAATLNFAFRNAGNSVQTGYANFGVVTAPANVTAGDVTMKRLMVGLDTAFPAGGIIGWFNQPTLANEVLRISSVATNDDPTESVFQNRAATTDATVTTLHTYTVPASTTVHLVAVVVARRTGGTGGVAEDGAGYRVSATVKNVAGTATLIGAVNQLVVQEDQAGWDATIDVTAATARVRVTGALNNNVTWHVTLRAYPVGT